MSAWRPALRIARRSIRRSLGRSLLIAILIGVPVAGATAASIVARTLDSPERMAESAMGGADATMTVTKRKRLRDWDPSYGVPAEGRPVTVAEAEALLPPGSRVVPVQYRSDVLVGVGERRAVTLLAVTDLDEPLTRHEARLEAGRAPGADEVLVSVELAERLDVGIGAALTVDDVPVTVSGISRPPHCYSCEEVVAPPGSRVAGVVDATPGEFLVDLPPGVAGGDLYADLAARGVALIPRDTYLEPGGYGGGGQDVVTVDELRAAALAAVIVGLGLLEVVLLAGTAFAVGARRQTRELGLVASSGGSARDVRRIVLAQGLVLGALGAGLGVAAGAVLAFGGQPLWERFNGGDVVAWAWGPWEIGGAALVGLLSGVAAAVVPAIGAGRMRPVDALAERFRVTRRVHRRNMIIGGALLVAGGLCGLTGDLLLADDFAAYEQALADAAESGGYASTPTPTGPVALIVGGALLLVAGLVLLAPAAIGALAALGARLPLSSRLAVRDAARHRHRTGPATSAIAMAVAGSIVLAFVTAGSFRADELRYIPSLPEGLMSISLNQTGLGNARTGAQTAAAELPGSRVFELRQPLRELGPEEEIDGRLPEAVMREMYLAPADDLDGGYSGGAVAIAADDETNRALLGDAYDDEARAALDAGKVLVAHDAVLTRDGKVPIEPATMEVVELPAHAVDGEAVFGTVPVALVPRSVARDQGWEIAVGRLFVSYPPDAPDERVDAAVAAAHELGAEAWVDEGPSRLGDGILAAIAGIAAFVTLVGVAISIALSAAEGRADLATLAAVGAAPRRRRALAASQALLIAGLGCLLGVAGGSFVAYTARTTTGSPEFVVPWTTLGLAVLAVPVLAVLVAAVFTPSRLPMVRRAT